MLSLPLPIAISFSVTSSAPPSTGAGSCATFSTWLAAATKRSRSAAAGRGPRRRPPRSTGPLPGALGTQAEQNLQGVDATFDLTVVIALVLRVVTSSLVITKSNAASSTQRGQDWSSASWVTSDHGPSAPALPGAIARFRERLQLPLARVEQVVGAEPGARSVVLACCSFSFSEDSGSFRRLRHRGAAALAHSQVGVDQGGSHCAAGEQEAATRLPAALTVRLLEGAHPALDQIVERPVLSAVSSSLLVTSSNAASSTEGLQGGQGLGVACEIGDHLPPCLEPGDVCGGVGAPAAAP